MPAQAVYSKLGFRNEGIRKNYYEDTGEDAIIMWYRPEREEVEEKQEETL
jgi:ribosomal-protein-alanine N-acetyltransferase